MVSVMPIKIWEKIGSTREDLFSTNLILAAANRGAIYVAGKTQPGRTQRAVCQCAVEHTGHHRYDPAWKETWLRFADENRL